MAWANPPNKTLPFIGWNRPFQVVESIIASAAPFGVRCAGATVLPRNIVSACMADNDFNHAQTDFATEALGAARPPYDFLAKELEFETALRGSWPPSVMACLHTVPEAARAEALPRLVGGTQPPYQQKRMPQADGLRHPFSRGETRLRQIFVEREISEYFLGAMLGKGGMGEVFKALHKTMLRHVAIKLMRPRQMKDPAPISTVSCARSRPTAN